MSCSAVNCSSRTTEGGVKNQKLSFHAFPKCPERRGEWLKAIGRENWEPPKYARLCSKHFDRSCFVAGLSIKKLKYTAIPTIFEGYPAYFQMLNEDMENYREYKIRSVKRVRIKPSTIPSRFNSHNDRKHKLPPSISQSTPSKTCGQDLVQDAGSSVLDKDLIEPMEPTASYSSEDTWSAESNCEIETDEKLSILDIQENSLLPEDCGNMHFNCEDTKIFTPHWNSDASDNEVVCRICLAVDVKMYNIGDYKLKQYYQNLTGILSGLEDKLPNMLCWECAARLKNAHSFREKALRSYNLLMRQVKTDTSLSMSDVRSINRVENRLQSSLAVKYLSEDSYVWTSTGDSDDVTTPVTAQVKQEESGEEWLEMEVVDNGCDEDPLNTRPRTTAPPKARRRRAAVRTRTKGATKSRTVLDGAVFDVVDVPLERALAEMARRESRAEYLTALYSCDLCYKVFATPTARDEHALRHSDVMGEFECVVCRCRWRTSNALRKHFTESHTRDHICKKCPFTTRNRGVAKRHERFHKGVKFQCSQCPKDFATQSAYLSHLRLKHVCRFPCALCGFTFPTRRGVDWHKLKKHKRDKNTELAGPYCAECDVRFATDEAHDRHLQLTAAHRRDDSNGRRIRNDYHMAEKRKSRWKTSKEKSEHTESEQTEPDRRVLVCCEQCSIECKGYRAYAQHFRREHPGCNRTQYSGADPTMCEHCGKFFQNPYLLRAHAGVHTDAPAPSGARRAGSRHAGTPHRTHACPLCPKRFTEKSNRARHIVTIHHGAERRYRCAVCEKRFWERSGLQTHFDHVHLKKPWPKRTRPPRPRPGPVPGQEFESTGKDASAEA